MRQTQRRGLDHHPNAETFEWPSHIMPQPGAFVPPSAEGTIGVTPVAWQDLSLPRQDDASPLPRSSATRFGPGDLLRLTAADGLRDLIGPSLLVAAIATGLAAVATGNSALLWSAIVAAFARMISTFLGARA